jgi:hypothetical protein
VFIGQDARGPAQRRSSSLAPYVFGNGYSLTAFDLGNGGVKLELQHQGESEAAIILPSEEVRNLGRWLLATLGQDERGLPVELSGILERLSKAKIKVPILERGDKKRIKEALQTLRS